MDNLDKLSFVEKYKVILDIKKEHGFKINHSINKSIVIISTLFIIGVFVITGYISNMLENQYYVFLSVNTVLIGSFAIYKAIVEIRFKENYNLYYKTSIAITPDILSLISLICSVNGLFYLFFMLDTVSLIYIFILLLLGLILMYLYVKLTVPIHSHTIVFNFIKNSIILFVLLVINFYLLGIKSFALAYSISVLLVVLFCFYNKYMIYTQVVGYYINIFTILICTLAIIAGLNSINSDTNKFGFLGNEYVFQEYANNSAINIDIENIIYFDKDFLYYNLDNTIVVYDNEFNVIKSYNPNLDNIFCFYVVDSELYLVEELNSDNIYTYKIYKYDLDTLIEIERFDYDTRLTFVRGIFYNDSFIIIISENTHLYVYTVEDDSSLTPYIFDSTVVTVYYDTYQTYILRYSRFIYTNNNYSIGSSFGCLYYSNLKYFYQDLQQDYSYYIVDINNIGTLNNSTLVYKNIDFEFKQFTYKSDGNYYFVYKNTDGEFMLDIKNSYLKLLHSIDNLKSPYLFNNYIVDLIENNNSSSNSIILNMDFKINKYVLAKSRILSPIIFILIWLRMFFSNINLPFLKRGEL